MTRSLFKKGESYFDVQAALAKADTPLERKRLIWERMKANGVTKESEERFRYHCKVVGFILADEAGKGNPLAKDTDGRAAARLLADQTRPALRQNKTHQGEIS